MSAAGTLASTAAAGQIRAVINDGPLATECSIPHRVGRAIIPLATADNAASKGDLDTRPQTSMAIRM
ncbi:hypothetical protein SALBM217S_07388 [Streptomyces griseoloalbus]